MSELGGPKGITNAQIIVALRKNAGILAHAAADLGVTRASLSNRVNRDPELQAARHEQEDIVGDAAEGIVMTAILKEKDKVMARWYLEHKEKRRGYGDDLTPDTIRALVAALGDSLDALRAFRAAVSDTL